jgi:uncharacterized protein DUF4351
MVDHDRLFKELLTTFFLDFALFAPLLRQEVEPAAPVEFLEKELYTDVVAGERHEVDLLVKLRRRGEESFVLVHVENQATAEVEFRRRMFRYFARIEARHRLDVYPVAVFSYERPLGLEESEYSMAVAGLDVLRFRFLVVQLNQLSWRAFLRHPNPVAAALMSRMRIAEADRPRVKLECLRMLTTLRLDSARIALISGFVDTYLKLEPQEKRLFDSELETVPEREKEGVMEITTSWKEEGLQQGSARIVSRQLVRRCGPLPVDMAERVGKLPAEALDRLADALLDFSSLADLERWLAKETR